MRSPSRIALCLLLFVCACRPAQVEETRETPAASASAEPSAARPSPDGVVLPPREAFDNNPLKLPMVRLDVAPGTRVYTVPARMLVNARLGASFVLAAATIQTHDGDNVVVAPTGGVPFAAHPAYVVVPKPGRMGRGTLLIAPHKDRLHHAVAKNMDRKKLVVRLTDLGRKVADEKLEPSDVGVLPEGTLAPGGYAVVRRERDHEHVVLVSSSTHADGKKKWLVLGTAGASQLVDVDQLLPLPPARYRPRVGDSVLAVWRGSMVAGELRDIDEPGIYVVKRPRAGAPLVVGPGMIMPGPAPEGR